MADAVTGGSENDATHTAEDKQPNKKNDNVDTSKQRKDSEETPVVFALDENIRVVDINNIGKELETLNIENAKEKSSNSENMDVDNEIITISEKVTEQPKSTLPPAPPPAKKFTRSRDIIYTRPEDPLRTSPPPQCEEIIIDLDDDDDEEERRKRKRGKKLKTCCNFNCEYGENLFNAPSFVLTYYQIKYVKGKPQKVCTKCFEAAISHNEHLYHILSEHKPLLKLDFPTRTDTVIIQDSDSDDSDEDEPMAATVIKDIEDKLMEVIDATQENYDLGFQLDESKTYLDSKISGLEAEFREIDNVFNRLQKTIDRRRTELYEGYAAPIQELSPLMISDSNLFCNTSDTLRSPPSTPVYTSPSKRLGSSNVDGPRRSPIRTYVSAGVATKKVTQVQQPQRGVFAGSSVAEPSKEAAVEVLRQVEASEQPMLPPIGPLVRPRAVVGDLMYVMKQGYYGVWSRAKVLEVIPKSGEGGSTTYKIKFEYRKSNPVKIVTGRHMAYPQSCPVRFPVGTRVIALFRDEWPKECYYAGVIAEPPKSTNKFRYLVFFDDGYAQYVSHDKILLVCESSRNVWEDIHPESRDFVKNYLEEYPERPMVKLQQGQIVKTEWNGKWWIARVAEVDGSLVKMHFDADGRTEWIYRGSTRLGPLFAELAQAAARKNQSTFSRHRGLGIASLKKRNMPYVEYTRTDMEELKHDESGASAIDTDPSKQYPTPVRAVAKKSTTKRPESTTIERNDYIPTADRTQPQGRIEYLQINTKACPKKFRPHQCGQTCMANLPHNLQDMKGYNPLVIPLLCGWQRHIVRYRGKRVVLYKAPCGRRLRNLEELHRYLRVTKSIMSVDQFDFDFWVHCFAEFILDDIKIFTNIKDLSYGAENVAVPCVNYVDHSLPDYVNYSTVRQPMEGVCLNTDPEFLTGCDCTDDCQDREKCSCWQLTIQGTAFGQQGSAIDPTVGYIYKRLPEPVMTGIYECNSRCKCASTCLNRVAQHPLQLRLQVFKTENRGWGIRCLNDIPQGCFICIYAGRLLTEQGANEGGKNYGDEYLAELDYIEVVERLKEGYESDVLEDEDSCSLKDTGNATLKESAPSDSLTQNESGSDEEEDGELSQDAPDSDEEYQLSRTQKRTSIKHSEEGSIRSRLRKRALQGDSEDSQDKDRDKFSVPDKEGDKEGDKESEKSSSDEKDVKKTEPFKKPFSTCPSDEFITLSDDEDESTTPLREPSRFSAVTEIIKKEPDSKPKHRSVREFFGLEEYCYIMDAKNNGNIGRYLNHSCSPNVFVQNVFVDTHDLRFPWVAFFALTYIRAGTELTWDYNYDVGSVPGKVMYCHCGSTDCRGRLL